MDAALRLADARLQAGQAAAAAQLLAELDEALDAHEVVLPEEGDKQVRAACGSLQLAALPVVPCSWLRLGAFGLARRGGCLLVGLQWVAHACRLTCGAPPPHHAPPAGAQRDLFMHRARLQVALGQRQACVDSLLPIMRTALEGAEARAVLSSARGDIGQGAWALHAPALPPPRHRRAAPWMLLARGTEAGHYLGRPPRTHTPLPAAPCAQLAPLLAALTCRLCQPVGGHAARHPAPPPLPPEAGPAACPKPGRRWRRRWQRRPRGQPVQRLQGL